MHHTRNIAFAGLLVMATMSAQATAAEFECTSDSLMKHVSEQTREIDAYISSSDNPQQTQQELTSMARGLRENGQVSNHDDEMKKLASGAEFQPSQSFCNDMQTTMAAIRSYMGSHPH